MGEEAPPPSIAHLTAPAAWTAIEFVSDLHLSEDTPRTFEAFSHYLRSTDADAVLLLGDVFEAWPGDDARDDPFETQVVSALHAASNRLAMLGFMVGNRDFLVGPDLLQAAGMRHLDDPTAISAFGQRVLITHGDALCLADTDYLRFRAQVRDRAWQRQVLALPLAVRRAQAKSMRSKSEMQAQLNASNDSFADVDGPAARAWMKAADATTLIHGHTHRPASEALGPHETRHVLSDWDGDHEPARAEVLRWTAAGFERIRWPTSASAARA